MSGSVLAILLGTQPAGTGDTARRTANLQQEFFLHLQGQRDVQPLWGQGSEVARCDIRTNYKSSM